ncbi:MULTISPECIES: DUF190 domain-containing protein [unclassified Caulobacter]|jgi:PII-like signaling protein|uniref:DUF190 domain-containing protein n=1 Tax=unclassified Caulobacter TaxID=2648921 RepID=UPI00155264A0|nr:DUF190 domain-containing protein [Caulobacter sp. RHG1]NQE65330.1 hypothetical protein [Caulobacter sp. RHG1]
MQIPGQAVLLRIYTDDNASVGDRSLRDVIVQRAREARLAGATVLRGNKGFGESARVHEPRPFEFNDNLPIVIEIVDEEARLRAFLPALADLKDIGLMTFEKVEVLRYGGHRAQPHAE